MQTVNFPCVHCKKMMAVTTDDLGCQVHCPHCDQVVVAPRSPGAPASASPFEPTYSAAANSENDSIFTPPEEAGEDLFGIAAPPPRVEFPVEPTPAPKAPHEPRATPPRPEPDTPTLWHSTPSQPSRPAPVPEEVAEAPTLAATPGPDAQVAVEDTAEVPAPQPVVRRPKEGSMVLPMLLIFLIPYAIVVTGALAWMLYLQQQQRLHPLDPLERMLDTSKDGAPRRVQHDLPLPARLHTRLNETITVGDTAVTPLAIQALDSGSLRLQMRIKNVSSDTAFNPLPASFSQIPRQKKGTPPPPPYTFLEFGGQRIYGGDPSWSKKGADGSNPFSFQGDLQPGEEMTADLETPATPADAKTVALARAFPGPLLWRVHVRRGFVEARGQSWPASAVIGVDFSARDIQPAREAQGG